MLFKSPHLSNKFSVNYFNSFLFWFVLFLRFSQSLRMSFLTLLQNIFVDGYRLLHEYFSLIILSISLSHILIHNIDKEKTIICKYLTYIFFQKFSFYLVKFLVHLKPETSLVYEQILICFNQYSLSVKYKYRFFLHIRNVFYLCV